MVDVDARQGLHRVPGETVAAVAIGRRVVWGAIFAGVVVAVVLQLLLNLLGVGIGLEVIDPAERDTPGWRGFGISAAVWWLVATLVALFFGGWVAGRMAGVPRRTAGGLHGLVVWSVATLVGVYLATSVVGSLASGVFGALGAGASALGDAAGAAAAPATQPGAQPAPPAAQPRDTWAAIEREVSEMLRQTGDPNLQPGALQQQGQQAASDAQAAADVPRDPSPALPELRDAWTAAVERGRGVVSHVDRQDLANVLAARTGRTPEEARRMVDRWANQLQPQAQPAPGVGAPPPGPDAERLEAQARAMAQDTAEAASTAALWAFGILVLGALAAAAGGALGAPPREDVLA